MSLYNYVDTINANLICCICRAPFTDPTTTITCAHTFCADCIMRALSHAASCPVDRTPLGPADLGPANPIVRALVDELRVECVHRADGCEYVSQRQVMPLHLRDECEYAEVRCEEKEGEEVCGAGIRRMELKAHRMEVHGLKEDEEEKKEIISQNTEEAGGEEEKETYTCPHASTGCPYKGPLKASEHLLLCPYESLKGFFTANGAKMTLLTEQNMVLRHKVDTLEHTVHIMRKEMNAAKNALGPWFRSSYQGVNASAHGGTGVGVGWVTSSDLPIEMQPATAGPSAAGLEESGDALAQYFPAEDTMLRGQWTPSGMGDSMYGRAGGVVAPLDLGTTLEGTLVGLRESVVGLAAGVDSVGRRGEIALANETLRLGEEMMSVRAQMHGLRMQVHGMMMDRNAALSMREEAGPGMGAGGPYVRGAHTNFGSITKL